MLCVNVGICMIVVTTVMGVSIGASTNHPFRGKHGLDNAPLIDGHNNLPFNLDEKLSIKLADRFFEQKLASDPSSGRFDVLLESHVRQVDGQEDLEAKLTEAGDKLVVVDFFASWCGPCKRIAPQVELLAKESPNIVFLKVDVDKNEDLCNKYEIYAIPTFVFIKNGKQLDTLVGADINGLKKKIAQYH